MFNRINRGLLLILLLFFIVVSPVDSNYKTERLIIVDQNLIIKKIINYSNKSTIDPIVILDNSSGVELPFTESIDNQYKKILKKINLKKNGVVYEKKDLVNLSIIDLLISLFRKMIGQGN